MNSCEQRNQKSTHMEENGICEDIAILASVCNLTNVEDMEEIEDVNFGLAGDFSSRQPCLSVMADRKEKERTKSTRHF